jgi:hypothetical protein
MRVIVAVMLCVGCGRAVEIDRPDGGEPADSGTVVTAEPDAGQPMPDAGTTSSTWAFVAPIFFAKCTRCHEAMNGGLPSFADNYSVALQPATRLCQTGTIGQCIKAALLLQDTEGGRCRTYMTPFHRESWVCLTQSEIDLVVRWVDSGMPQ